MSGGVGGLAGPIVLLEHCHIAAGSSAIAHHPRGVVRAAVQQHHGAVGGGLQVGQHALKVQADALGVKVAAGRARGRQGWRGWSGAEKGKEAQPVKHRVPVELHCRHPWHSTASLQASPAQHSLRHPAHLLPQQAPAYLYSLHSTPASAKMFLWLPQVGREM